MDSFNVHCGYCGGIHAAVLGAYPHPTQADPHPIYGVTCTVTGTRYGVCAETNSRVGA